MGDIPLRRIIEACIFASAEPVQVSQLKKTLSPQSVQEIEQAIGAIKERYNTADSALRLVEVAGGFRFATAPELGKYLRKWFKVQRPRLTRASLETLSIVAYRQPVTRTDVESIRGVNVEGALSTLLERGLVRIVGRKEGPGRPMLYGTTRLFLEHFGLGTLKDLPALNDFSEHDLNEGDYEKVNVNKPDKDAAPLNRSEIPASRQTSHKENADRATLEESGESESPGTAAPEA